MQYTSVKPKPPPITQWLVYVPTESQETCFCKPKCIINVPGGIACLGKIRQKGRTETLGFLQSCFRSLEATCGEELQDQATKRVKRNFELFLLFLHRWCVFTELGSLWGWGGWISPRLLTGKLEPRGIWSLVNRDFRLPWASAPDWDANGSHTHQSQRLGKAATKPVPKGSSLGCSGLLSGTLGWESQSSRRQWERWGWGGFPTHDSYLCYSSIKISTSLSDVLISRAALESKRPLFQGVRKRNAPAPLVGRQTGAAPVESHMESPLKIQVELPYDPLIALLCIDPKNTKTLIQEDLSIPCLLQHDLR